VKGCCVCAFIPIDREQRTQQMSVDAKTSLVISELLGALAGENSFDIAMNDMLVKTAELTNAERVCVFECYGPSSELSFEWCAEGVESQLGVVKGLSSAVLKSWFGGTKDDPVTLVPDSDRLARFSPALYIWCMKSHVKNLMVAPFYNEGEIVGFLGAYNYRLDDSVDIKRVFSEIRSFVGARIENRRLIDSLDWAGKHDALTGLLNRRGFQAAMDAAGVKQVDAPVVIALMDLDNFKHTNDTYGHACGDEALCEMARFLERVFPEDAILCRTGGDEFMVCLLGEDAERIEEIVAGFKAQKVEYMFEGVKRSMTASIGYSLHAGKDFSMREAFAQADEALYEDKRNKRLR
jgi:diguanylate cyclase (GGDEF)-like protein